MPSAELRVQSVCDPMDAIEPAPALWHWIRATFLEESSPLYNGEHQHLRFADVGILWSNVGNHRQMRTILGHAEMPMARGGKWAKARHDLQLRDWFGGVPDFAITLFAPWCAAADDASFCALVEHELTHCAQARNAFGAPRFSRSTGRPIFALRGHDVEEFVSVVRRYGPSPDVQLLVDAVNQRPPFDVAHIAAARGTIVGAAA